MGVLGQQNTNFLIDRMCLTNDDGSQTNTRYVTVKKEKGTDYVLS